MMADPRRFLHARIGRVDEWTVHARLVEGTLPGRREADEVATLRRWVSLEEKRGDLLARMGDAHFLLRLSRRSEHVRVRNQLGSWSRPFVAHLSLSGDADGRLEGSLVVMRTALPSNLHSAPFIVVPPELLDGIPANERPRLAELAEDIVLPSGDGPVMVVQTPMLIGALSTGAPKITVHLHRRWRLDCDIRGVPGAQYLLVRGITRSGSAGTVDDGRFIACPSGVQVVATEDEVVPSDLGPLLPRRQPIIDAWIAYEQLVQDDRLRSLDVRREHPLEYTEVTDASRSAPQFRVELASPQEAHDHWLDSSTQKRRKMRVRVAAELSDLDEQTDPMRCEIVGFESTETGGLRAVIKLSDDRRVPTTRGRLLAIEDEGAMLQRERRKRALDRLRFGTSANPELLGWLLNPASVPDTDSARAGASMTGLDEHQRRAVALATRVPSIVLVLGPPGSGKTTVIRAIVDEHRRRAERVHASEEAPAPFRILVTSVQNEAVDNVAEKVGGSAGIEVWHVGNKDAREARASSLARDAHRIASELWTELRDSTRFITYERLHHLRDSVAVIRRTFFELGLGQEVAERLHSLAAASERLVLTPLLETQLIELVERIDASLAAAPDSNEAGDLPASRLATALRIAVEASSRLDVETWKALSGALDEINAAVQTPAAADGPWADLGESWNDLRRQLRRAARHGFASSLVDAFDGLRDETLTALATTTQTTVATSRSSGPTTALVDEVHSWLQRASSLVERELDQRAHQEEAVLFRWAHTLAKEPSRLEEIVERHAMVTAATCQRVDRSRQGELPTEYDVVIVDEAARAGIDVLVPMTLGKSIVLVGDHRQLPPHVEKDLAERLEEGIREEIDLERESLFSWLWKRIPRGNLVSLSRQYRMHENIGRAVSRLFYEPDITLSHHFSDERAAARRPDFGICSDEPLVWVDTSDVLQDPALRSEERIAPWPCVERNEYEASLVVKLLKRASRDALLAWRTKEGKKPVGVIAFYGEQVAVLEQRLESELGPSIFDLVQLGSVDSFQGREFPLVILSSVRSNRDGFVGFLRLPNRINVAMSRAQRQLIVLGDSRTLAARGDGGSPPLRQLFEDISVGRVRGKVFASTELVR